MRMSLPLTSGDDLPTSDRHDYASAQWYWLDETQPPSEWDGAEDGGEEDAQTKT
jgi:hypothetical protein